MKARPTSLKPTLSSAARLVAAGACLFAAMGAAQASLVLLGDGTVKDTAINLIWLQDWTVNGNQDWATQNTWAQDLHFASSSNWALPSFGELQALAAYGTGTLISAFNWAGTAATFWAGTKYDATNAYYEIFGGGGTSGWFPKTARFSAGAVRLDDGNVDPPPPVPDPTSLPEPASLAGTALAGLALARRRATRSAPSGRGPDHGAAPSLRKRFAAMKHHLVALSAVAMASAGAHAGVVSTLNVPGGFYFGCLGTPNALNACGHAFGQTFTVDTAQTRLTDFSFYLPRVFGSHVTVQFNLFAWDGSDKTGSALYQSAVVDYLGTGSGQLASFAPNVTLTQGQTYIAFLEAGWASNAKDDYTAFTTVSDASYTGGQFVFINNVGNGGWSQTFSDSKFSATFADADAGVTLPEPASLALAGAALVAAVVARRRKQQRTAA